MMMDIINIRKNAIDNYCKCMRLVVTKNIMNSLVL